jgi:hypothetical protein
MYTMKGEREREDEKKIWNSCAKECRKENNIQRGKWQSESAVWWDSFRADIR